MTKKTGEQRLIELGFEKGYESEFSITYQKGNVWLGHTTITFNRIRKTVEVVESKNSIGRVGEIPFILINAIHQYLIDLWWVEEAL